MRAPNAGGCPVERPHPARKSAGNVVQSEDRLRGGACPAAQLSFHTVPALGCPFHVNKRSRHNAHYEVGVAGSGLDAGS